jgi:glutathione S-transferase
VWVEYPDIEATCKRIGALPTLKKANGSPLYTLPVIHDPSTGAVIAESGLIAEYLDATYPDTPKLFPPGTKALQYGFLAAHRPTLSALWQLTMPATPPILNPPSRDYFKATKFGPGLKDEIISGKEREEQFAKLREGFDVIDGWLQKEEGPFVMGQTISFVDLVVAGYILWMKKLWREESTEWTEVKGWHGGRWEALLAGLEKYETI